MAGNSLHAQIVAAQADDEALVNELFLRILNRPAQTFEVDAALQLMSTLKPAWLAWLCSTSAMRTCRPSSTPLPSKAMRSTAGDGASPACSGR